MDEQLSSTRGCRDHHGLLHHPSTPVLSLRPILACLEESTTFKLQKALILFSPCFRCGHELSELINPEMSARDKEMRSLHKNQWRAKELRRLTEPKNSPHLAALPFACLHSCLCSSGAKA